jgi:hypothetical protein
MQQVNVINLQAMSSQNYALQYESVNNCKWKSWN